tara:strand:- start:4826 stop:4978 length:153 start_codon:yes stop_codon:yes gene_type:complete
MICPECDGEGYVERKSWFGPWMEPCTNCYEGLGEVPDESAAERAADEADL